jgi:uncharacterized peroxidase-related enzyme
MAKKHTPMALKIKLPPPKQLDPDMRKYFAVCVEKIGFLPNVLACYSFNQSKLRAFVDMYNDLMLGDSGLSKLEREMIAVVVSAANRCFYCLTAHGAAVRALCGDPERGEQLVMNYRSARLSRRHRAMLDYANKLTLGLAPFCNLTSIRCAESASARRTFGMSPPSQPSTT